MTSSAAIFTPLPTEDHEEEIGSQSVITEKNTDQILDGLLAKVGYGLFQKKLLVTYKKKCVFITKNNSGLTEIYIFDRFYAGLDGWRIM